MCFLTPYGFCGSYLCLFDFGIGWNHQESKCQNDIFVPSIFNQYDLHRDINRTDLTFYLNSTSTLIRHDIQTALNSTISSATINCYELYNHPKHALHLIDITGLPRTANLYTNYLSWHLYF